MKCSNYEEEKRRCRYYEALHGTGEDPPTGMNSTGRCDVAEDMEDINDWLEAEPEDCDMLDLE